MQNVAEVVVDNTDWRARFFTLSVGVQSMKLETMPFYVGSLRHHTGEIRGRDDQGFGPVTPFISTGMMADRDETLQW